MWLVATMLERQIYSDSSFHMLCPFPIWFLSCSWPGWRIHYSEAFCLWLPWLSSFNLAVPLSNSVSLVGRLCFTCSVWMPQRSILCPALLCLHFSPSDLIQLPSVRYYLQAGESQVCVSSPVLFPGQWTLIYNCLLYIPCGCSTSISNLIHPKENIWFPYNLFFQLFYPKKCTFSYQLLTTKMWESLPSLTVNAVSSTSKIYSCPCL